MYVYLGEGIGEGKSSNRIIIPLSVQSTGTCTIYVLQR